MTPLLFISVLAVSFSAMGLLASLVLTRTARATSTRVMQVTQGIVVEDVDTTRSPSLDVANRLLQIVRWARNYFGMSEKGELIERFAHAGYKSSIARDTYFAARIVGPILGAVGGSFIPFNHFFCMTALAGVFYLAPDIVLTRLVKRRRERIRRAIPDAIDLLVICVDAGLGMDQALLRVSQELGNSHPDIREEFMQMNREQRAGLLRLDAWQGFAKRAQLVEIDGFVNMLTQTERFGTPIARALASFGDNIRQKRRQRAEELAAKTTVKIIFPLVLCIFPAMFIVLLGPAGITIARGLKTMNQ